MKKLLLFTMLSLTSLITFAQTLITDENECLNYEYSPSDVKLSSSSKIVVNSVEATIGDVYSVKRSVSGAANVEMTLVGVEDIDDGILEVSSWSDTNEEASYFYGYFDALGEFVSDDGDYSNYKSIMESVKASRFGREYITGYDAIKIYQDDVNGQKVNRDMYYRYINNWSSQGVFPVSGLVCTDGGSFTFIPVRFRAGCLADETKLIGFKVPDIKSNKAKNYFVAKEKLPGSADAASVGMFLYSKDCSKLYAVAPSASGKPGAPAKYTLDNATKEIYVNAFANCHDIELFVSSDVKGDNLMGGTNVVIKYLYPVEGVPTTDGYGFKITSPLTEGALNKALRETDPSITLKNYKYIDARDAIVKFDIEVDNSNPNQIFYFNSKKFENNSTVTGQNVIINNICEELVLTDKVMPYIPFAFQVSNATYKRSVTADAWGSLIMPFSVSSSDLSKLMKVGQLSKYDTSTKKTTFVWTKSIEANAPYIFKGLKNADAITTMGTYCYATNGIEYDEDVNGMRFIGTYKEYPKGTSKGDKYGVQTAGGVVKYTDTAAIYPFRAYFIYPEGVSEAKIRVIDPEEDEDTDNFEIPDYTAIVDITDINLNEVKAYYSLSGVKINNLKSGFNIVRMNSGAVYKVFIK